MDTPAKTLETAVLYTFCCGTLRARSKPGEAYSKLPKRLIEKLKDLKSDHLKNVRPDSIIL